MLGLGISLARGAFASIVTYVKDGLKLFYNFKIHQDNPITHASAGSTSFVTDDYISIADANNLSFGDGSTDSAFTISAWVKMDDATNFTILNKGVYNTDAEWNFRTNASDKLVLALYDESVSSTHESLVSDSTITTHEGSWIHIVGTYNGVGGASANGGLKLYLNGISLDSTASDAGTYVAMENLAGDVYIGKMDSSYADGSIANVGIWSRALSASEVQGIMYKKYADLGSVDKASLVSWYGLDEESLGSELVTNGTFDTDTSGWTANSSTLSVDSARLKVDGSGGGSRRAYQDMTVVVGSTYRYTVDVVSGTSNARLRLGTTSDGSEYFNDTNNATGSYSFDVVATGTTMSVGLMCEAVGDCYFDNVMVKELTLDDAHSTNHGSPVGSTTNSTIYGDNAPSKPRILDSANPKQAVQLAEGSTSFDATDDYVDCGSDSSLDNIFDGGGTISAWIYPESDGEGDEGRIVDKRDDGNGFVIHVRDESGGACGLKVFQNYSTTSGQYILASRDITIGEWNHIAITYDTSGSGSSYRPTIYVNGDSKALTISADSSGSYTTDEAENFIIGNTEGGIRTFDGSLANVSIHSSALTQSQIQELMFTEKYAGLSADLKTNLVSWYDLGDTSLGSELVSNGDFTGGTSTNDGKDYPTGWTVYNWSYITDSSVSDNSFRFTSNNHLGGIYVSGAYVSGKKYQMDITYKRHTSDASTLNFYNGSWVEISPTSDSVDTEYTKSFEFTSTTANFIIARHTGTTTSEYELISVSLKEAQATDNHSTNEGSIYGATTTTGYTSSPHGVVDPINYGTLKSGTALSFDGVNDYVEVADDASIDIGTSDFSISAWVSVDDTSQIRTILTKSSGWGAGQSTQGFYFGVHSTGVIRFEFRDGSTRYDNFGTQILDTGKVYYIIAGRSGGDAFFYIDGKAETVATSNSYSGDLSNAISLRIGYDAHAPRMFDGLISNVKIFNSALTESEIQEMYLNPEQILPTGVSSSNLKLWLPLQEGSGTTNYDGSGNNNDGTITGATWVKAETDIAQVGLVRQNKPCVIVNDNIDLGSAGNSALSFAHPNWSISCWLYQAGEIDGSTNYPFGTNETYQSVGALFRIAGADLKPYMRTNQASASTSLTGTSALTLNAWNHVIFTYNGTTGTWYLNGSANGSGSITAPVVSTNQFVIGKSGSQYYDGIVNEFAVWDEALTATEVTALYNSGTPLDATTDSGNYASSIGLQGYWRNDGDTTWTDRTPLGAYGSELVTFGTFDSDDTASWSGFYDSLTFDTDHFNLQRSSADGRAKRALPISLTTGKAYRVSVVAKAIGTSQNIKVGVTNTSFQQTDLTAYSAGTSYATYTHDFIADSDTDYAMLWNNSSSSNVDYKSYSIKKYRGGNDGTVAGSPDSIVLTEGITSGRDSQGFYLTNTDENVLTLNGAEYVEVPDSDVLDFGTGDFSVECWFKTSMSSGNGTLVCKANGDASTMTGFNIDIRGGNDFFVQGGDGTNRQSNTGGGDFSDGNWHHSIVVFNRSSGIIKYVDGSAVGTASGTLGTGTLNVANDLAIGYAEYSDDEFYTGDIDDVRIYSDALSSDEVTKNWNAGKSKHRN